MTHTRTRRSGEGGVGAGGGSWPDYNGLYGEPFFRLEIHERAGISLVEVYTKFKSRKERFQTHEKTRSHNQ